MNKFQKIGVAIVFASGMAFAQLWSVNADHGQVQFPWVVECTSSPAFDETNDNDPCYKNYGGWWYGYLAGPDTDVGPKNCAGKAWMPPSGGSTTKVNKVEAKISGNWVTFVGTDDPVACEGPAITNKQNGNSLMGPNGLELKLVIGPGDLATFDPSIAAIGVNLSNSTKSPKNIGAPAPAGLGKDGFCLTYISDHTNTMEPTVNSGANLAIELGWDEGEKGSEVRGFDTWYSILPEAPNGQRKTVDFRWTRTSPTPDGPGVTESGDFISENWTMWPSNVALGLRPWPITTATDTMTAVKIRLKGYVATTVNFTLVEFGFAGTCNGGGTPIIGGKNAPSVNFAMNGKVLTASIAKPAVVQVYNLQGAMVKSQALTPNSNTMNLSNLPTGIYMVRAPSLGYTGRIVVK